MKDENWFVHWFWQVYDYLSSIIPPIVSFLNSNFRDAWPDFATTGLATSYAAMLASFPYFLVVGLVLVWSIANVGPARKTLSTAVILAFVVPVYPILTALVLAIFWTILAFAAWAMAIALPLFLVALTCVSLCECVPREDANVQPSRCTVLEICCSIAMGLAMSVAGFCTFGICAFTLTLHETPASVVTRIFAQALLHLLSEDVKPDIVVVGFLVSYAASMACLPFYVSVGMSKIWFIQCKHARPAKAMGGSVLMTAIILYPMLAGLVLAALWVLISFFLTLLSVALPIFLIGLSWSNLWLFAHKYIQEQREESVTVDDISFFMLFFGFAMGIFSLCTFGILAFLLTLCKSPVLFVCCIYHFIYHTIPAVKGTGWWCPLSFLGWCFAFLAGICGLILGIIVSALTKLVLAAIWPAYIATGWLRFFGGGGRRRDGDCCAPLIQGMKAGYQVLWASDLLTNALIVGDFELFQQTINEFAEIATGQREQLSPECRKIACLPPVIVGLFLGSWDMAERVIAKELGITTDAVREAWTSLREQMIRIGKEDLANGLLTEDYILAVPPELVIGLPARCLLETIERSAEGEILLASGLRVTADRRPRGLFVDKVWGNLQDAQKALSDAELSADMRRLLCGALLSGGGEHADLPPSLANAVREFDQIPAPMHEKCVAVRNHLISVAIECSRQRTFREQLEKVIQTLGQGPGAPDRDAAYKLLAGMTPNPQNRQQHEYELAPTSP